MVSRITKYPTDQQLAAVEGLVMVEEGEEAGFIVGMYQGKFLTLSPEGTNSSHGAQAIEQFQAKVLYGRIKELIEEKKRGETEPVSESAESQALPIPTAEVRKTGLDALVTDLFGKKK